MLPPLSEVPEVHYLGAEEGDPQVPSSPNAEPGSVQLLSRVQLFATPWTAAHQAFLSITLPEFTHTMYTKSGMPFNHLILCHPFLLLSSIFPSIRVFSNELAFCISG